MKTKWDAVVVGAGAAGYFCALQLAEQKPEWSIAIMEQSNKTLSKVKVSGGGRCNVTNGETRNKVFLEGYPRGAAHLKTLFQRFGPQATKEWFQKAGLDLVAEADGRMFPRQNTSQAVIDLFERRASQSGIQIFRSHALLALTSGDEECQISLKSASGEMKWEARYVVLAMGGVHKESVWEPLKGLELTRVPSVPSLFTFQVQDPELQALSGLSVPQARVWMQGDKRRFDGPLLITHWGLSGPAILKASAFLARELAQREYTFTAHINFLGSEWGEQSCMDSLRLHAQTHADKQLKNAVPFGLPARLFAFILSKLGKAEHSKWSELGPTQQRRLIENLVNYQAHCKGKTTFKEEFVTAGGVALSELDKDGSLRKYPRIWVVGEMLDIDGMTGGYNFQAAWTTAWAAAEGIAARESN
ncbi:MAG: hypothetical protein RL577_1565 [Bacteroidota bacterium]